MTGPDGTSPHADARPVGGADPVSAGSADQGRRAASPAVVAAHRGASRLAPENTLAAFEQALSLGALAVELDVQLTADGEVVVLHDLVLDRTTDGSGPVCYLDAQEIRRLDAGAWFGLQYAGTQVPLLAEVLEAVADRARLHVELKGFAMDILAEKVVEELRRHDALERVVVMSADLGGALATRRLEGGLCVLAIVGEPLGDQLGFVLATGLGGLNQPPALWHPETIARFHDNGLVVHGSLVNDEATLARFLECGGDTADSDEPACFGGRGGRDGLVSVTS